MAIQPQAANGPRQQVLLVAGLVAVLVLIIGLLVMRPLLRGGTEPVASPPAAAVAAPPATGAQLIGPSTTVVPAGEAASAVKDPFRPLVGNETATTQTGLSPTPAAGTGAATATTIAAAQPTVPGAGAGSATAPGGGTSAEARVTLDSITGGSAKVSVDGTSYTVQEGESFAGDYRAVDIGSQCASFESGDTPFTLCEGEAVLK